MSIKLAILNMMGLRDRGKALRLHRTLLSFGVGVPAIQETQFLCDFDVYPAYGDQLGRDDSLLIKRFLSSRVTLSISTRGPVDRGQYCRQQWFVQCRYGACQRFYLSVGPIPGRFVPLNLNEGLGAILDLKIDRRRGDSGRSSGDLG